MMKVIFLLSHNTLGKPPSTQKPYGPYPLVITPDSNPDGRVLVVQDFAYGKYLGHLKVEFDDDGKATSWSGNPIILNNSVTKDSTVLQQVQQMKPKVAELSDVSIKFSFASFTLLGTVLKVVMFTVLVSLRRAKSGISRKSNKQTNKTKQNKTEQNRTEQNRTEQNRTEQNRTEQNRTEQNRTKQNKTTRCIEVL